MKITLNGKAYPLRAGVSVASLVASLSPKPEQVAVAINGEVVRRAEWEAMRVRDGDAVEVVRAVGGGAL